MTDYFAAAAQIVLEEEGVFNNSAQDPGGETWYGISRVAHPTLTPWPPTKAQALEVYRADYWDPHSCGDMPWAWALAIFDGVVNQGIHVIGMAQEALGIPDDSFIGPQTLAAMKNAPAEDYQLFLALRLTGYTMDAGFSADGKGWFKRVIGIAMAAATEPGGQ